MSKEVDYDNLTLDDVTYLGQRAWMPQPTAEQLAKLGLEPLESQRDMGPDDTDRSNTELVDLTGLELKEIVEPEDDDQDSDDDEKADGADDDDPTIVVDGDDIIFEDDEPNEMYADLNEEQLKFLCRERNLSQDGDATALIARLESDDEAS